jgi:TRAP-type C4-dicarboxylate transport system permease small subunit
MSKRASIIYLCLAPVLFALSWYISHRMYTDYLASGVGVNAYQGKERSLMYATTLTVFYIAFYFVIQDIYKKKK